MGHLLAEGGWREAMERPCRRFRVARGEELDQQTSSDGDTVTHHVAISPKIELAADVPRRKLENQGFKAAAER